jgi:hypothetical protein
VSWPFSRAVLLVLSIVASIRCQSRTRNVRISRLVPSTGAGSPGGRATLGGAVVGASGDGLAVGEATDGDGDGTGVGVLLGVTDGAGAVPVVVALPATPAHPARLDATTADSAATPAGPIRMASDAATPRGHRWP